MKVLIVALSIQFCFRFLPPYIIYKAAKLYSTWVPKNCFPGTRFNATLSGWSEEATFFDWLRKHFIPAVKNVQKPVLLVMDGHRSHISTRIIKLAMEHNIHMECLPPHTTTILQPLDVLTLSKVKQSWRKLLSSHFKQTNAQPLDKQKFALLVSFILFSDHYTPLFFKISKLFKEHLLPAHCSGGFSKAGIYPFDKRVISKEKLLQPATDEQDTSVSQSNTTDDIDHNSMIVTSTPRFRRYTSCPHIRSNGIERLFI